MYGGQVKREIEIAAGMFAYFHPKVYVKVGNCASHIEIFPATIGVIGNNFKQWVTTSDQKPLKLISQCIGLVKGMKFGDPNNMLKKEWINH